MMNNIAIYGGTFNPIHYGHLKMAKLVLEKYNFDRIIFIPSYCPPFKNLNSKLELKRLEMINIAIKNYPFFSSDDIEFHLPKPSYTYNTIMALYEKYKISYREKFNFIIGMDAFFKIKSWYNSEQLKRMVRFLLLPRIEDYNTDKDILGNLKNDGFDFIKLDFKLINISSTDIRQKVKNQKQIDNLVPKEIMEYIYEQGLYR